MTDTGWKAAVKASEHHRNPIKPKTQDGSDTNCYVYVPRDWLGERVLVLIGATDIDIEESGDGVSVLCDVEEFDRPTPYKRGTGAAVFVHGDYKDQEAIVLLEPESFALERRNGSGDS